MPTAAQLAKEEAERVEDELGGDNDDDEGAPAQLEQSDDDEVQEWPAEPTGEMWAGLRALAADNMHAVHRIMGPFVEGFVSCDECAGVGIRPPMPAEPQYATAPNTVACNVCEGMGQLSTGAKRQGYEIVDCTLCNGKGWIGPGNMPAAEAARLAIESVGSPPAVGQPPTMAPQQPPAQVVDPRVAQLQMEGYIIVPPAGRS